MMHNVKKSMSAIGFFFSLVSCGYIFAMDIEPEKKQFLFLDLLPEHQKIVWDYLTINNSGPVKETIKTLNSLAQVNKN